ncbi:MAG: hypothetical protein U0802_22755 [Candidatus Binatia bacterium]
MRRDRPRARRRHGRLRAAFAEEAAPTVLLEAMACGRASSPRVGGGADMIERSGVLIDPAAFDELTEALATLAGDVLPALSSSALPRARVLGALHRGAWSSATPTTAGFARAARTAPLRRALPPLPTPNR